MAEQCNLYQENFYCLAYTSMDFACMGLEYTRYHLRCSYIGHADHTHLLTAADLQSSWHRERDTLDIAF